MGVPPSTISRRVSELEADLRRNILVRTGRGVRPAEEAKETVARLRDVLHTVNACYTPAPTLTRLRVTAPVEMSTTLLPIILPGFRRAFPNVVVELRGHNRALGLVEEDFDLAIRAGVLADSSYIARKLPQGRFVVVATPDFAARVKTIEGLASASTVDVTGPSPGLKGRWKGKAFSIRSPSIARVDSFTAALPLVLTGDAYAAMPAHVTQDLIDDGRLTEITAVQLDEVPLHALYPRRHREQRAVAEFIDAVAGALK